MPKEGKMQNMGEDGEGRGGGFGDKTTFGLRRSNSLIVSKNYERLLGVRIMLSSDVLMATIISLGSLLKLFF